MSRSKILLTSVLASVLMLPLLNCGGSEHDPTEVYYLVTLNSKIPYWQTAHSGLQDAALAYKIKYEMVGPAAYNPQAQKEEFQKIVKKNPSGILVSVGDPAVLGPEIDAAVAQGIPVVTMDSDAPSSKRLMFIGTDNYGAGQMGGKVVSQALNGKGNVVVFTMPGQQNLKERLQGYEQAFRGTGVKITEVIDIKGDPAAAFDKTMEITDKKSAVDGFVCLEAMACPEVAEVLTRKGVTGKAVVAMDTDPRTLEWIQKGVISATIAQKPYTMAFFGTQILDTLHHHKPASLAANFSQDTRSPVPNFIDTGATLIDKNNVAAFMKAGNGQK